MRKTIYSGAYRGVCFFMIIVIFFSLFFGVKGRPELPSADSIQAFAESVHIPADQGSITPIFAHFEYDNGTDGIDIEVTFNLISAIGGHIISPMGVTNETGWTATELVSSDEPGWVQVNITAPEHQNFGFYLVDVEFYDTTNLELWVSPTDIPADNESTTNVNVLLEDFRGGKAGWVTITTDKGVFLDNLEQSIGIPTDPETGLGTTVLRSEGPVETDVNIDAYYNELHSHTWARFFEVPHSLNLGTEPEGITIFPADPDLGLELVAVVNNAAGVGIPGVFVEFIAPRGWIHELHFVTDEHGKARALYFPDWELGSVSIFSYCFPELSSEIQINIFGMARGLNIAFDQPHVAYTHENPLGIVNRNPVKGDTDIEIIAMLMDGLGHHVFQAGEKITLTTSDNVFWDADKEEWVNEVVDFTNEEGFLHFVADFNPSHGDFFENGELFFTAWIDTNQTYAKDFSIEYKSVEAVPERIQIWPTREVHLMGGEYTLIIAKVIDETFIPIPHDSSSTRIFSAFKDPNGIPNGGEPTNPIEEGDPAIYETEYSPDIEGFVRLIETIEFFYKDTYTEGIVQTTELELVIYDQDEPFVDLVRDIDYPGAGGDLTLVDIEGFDVDDDGGRGDIFGEIVVRVHNSTAKEHPPEENHYLWFENFEQEAFYLNVTEKVYIRAFQGSLEITYSTVEFGSFAPILLHFDGIWEIVTRDGCYSKGPGTIHINSEGRITLVNGELNIFIPILDGKVTLTNDWIYGVDPEDFIANHSIMNGVVLGVSGNQVYQSETERLFMWNEFSGQIVNYQVYTSTNISLIDWTAPDAIFGVNNSAFVTDDIPIHSPPETGIDDKYTEQFFVVAGVDSEGNLFRCVKDTLINSSGGGGGESFPGDNLQCRPTPSGSVPVTITGSITRTLKGNQWNILSIPFDTSINASGLGDQIGEAIINHSIVQRDPQTGDFESFIVGIDHPSSAFPINLTAAYYVWVTEDTEIMWSGSIDYNYFPTESKYELTTTINVSLKATDWTLISYPSFIHADINVVFSSTQLTGDALIVQIAIMDDCETFAFYINDENFPMPENFQIVAGEGYFLWTSETIEVIWTAE